MAFAGVGELSADTTETTQQAPTPTSPTQAESKSLANRLGLLQTAIGIITASIGVVAAVQALESKKSADLSAADAYRTKQALEERTASRADRETAAKLDAMAYDAVVKVLEMDRTRVPPATAEKRESAAIALIVATASESMKIALLGVLQSGPDVNNAVKVEASNVLDAIKTDGNPVMDIPALPPQSSQAPMQPVQISTLRGFRVVIFHCESNASQEQTDANKAVAQELVQELNARPETKLFSIRWESKPLPAVLNSSPGYSVVTNQVRFNPQDVEDAPSRSLVDLLNSTQAIQRTESPFERRAVGQRTPGYMSAFVCRLGSHS